MQRCDGNGITFDGTLADCDIYAVGISHQLAHPMKAENADIKVLPSSARGLDGAVHSGSSWRLQICEQDYRPVLLVNRRVPALQQPSCLVSHRQSFSGLLPVDGYKA